MDISSADFSRAFGDALFVFLRERGITISDAATLLGVERETLYTYASDNPKGKRPKARVELLFRACTLGFEFEHMGYRITAEALGPPKEQLATSSSEQLHLNFSREFKLTEDNGQVLVQLRRGPGRVEFSVLLEAAS